MRRLFGVQGMVAFRVALHTTLNILHVFLSKQSGFPLALLTIVTFVTR